MIKITQIKQYLKELPDDHFTFNIKYTQKELDYLNNLKILNSSSFRYFGSIDVIEDINYKDLDEFIKKITDTSNISILHNIITKLVNKITKAYNTKYCWLAIRVSLPNSNYDIPRWHKDGNFLNQNMFNLNLLLC